MKQEIEFNPNHLIGVGITTKCGREYTIASRQVQSLYDGSTLIPCYVQSFFPSVFNLNDGTMKVNIDMMLINPCDIVSINGVDSDFLDEVYEFEASDLKNGMTFSDYYGVDRWLEQHNQPFQHIQRLDGKPIMEEFFCDCEDDEPVYYSSQEELEDFARMDNENPDYKPVVETIESEPDFGKVVGYIDGLPVYELDLITYMGNY
jgi:hypothetical protein